MSIATTPEGGKSSSENSAQPEVSLRRGRWRAAVMAVALVAFWAYILALPRMEMLMFLRFLTRMGALLGLLLVTLAVWFSNSRFRWRDRFLVLLANVGLLIAAAQVSDKTINAFGLILGGLPWIVTGSALWLAAASQRSTGAQRAGLLLVPVLVFGVFSLLRWDGLDGSQQSLYAWRWSPTSEEIFAARPTQAASSEEQIAARDWVPQTGDWVSFRGAECEGVVTGLPQLDWARKQPKLVWEQRVGPAWSSMIVVDGFLVTQEQRGDSEAVVCYDAATGTQRWVHEEPGRFSEGLSGTGPRSTPTFHDGRIYAMGARGRLTCLAAKDGRKLWARDLIEEAAIPQWGHSTSPLAVDDLVIVFAGGGEKSLFAFRAETGEPVWSQSGGKVSYGTPQLATIDGVRQIVVHDNRALFAVNPDDGTLLWERPGGSEFFQPMLQPHVVGAIDLVVEIDSGIARLSAAQREGKWTIEEKWRSNRLKPSFNDFFIHKGHIYGLDDGILCCVELETGNRVWKKGRYGFGQLLLLPEHGQLLVLTEKGEGVLVAADPKGHQEQGKFEAIAGKTWNHPVLAHGKLYVRNAEEMACYDLAAGDAVR